jgi:integral membrane protein (TIGR01906 family)
MRILGIVARCLFIVCLPFLLITGSLGWAVKSVWLCQYGFEKYQVGITTGLTEPELKKTAIGLIRYFNSGEEYINLTVTKNNQPFELFNEREIIHLKDVKGLIRLDYWVWLGTAVYAVGYIVSRLFWSKRRYRPLAWALVGGGSLTLALMLALGLWALVGFDQLFLQFHLLSFANEFWQLDPTRDYLIMLFPQGFFYDAILICAGATAAGAIILGGLGGGYLVVAKKKMRT